MKAIYCNAYGSLEDLRVTDVETRNRDMMKCW